MSVDTIKLIRDKINRKTMERTCAYGSKQKGYLKE